MKIELTGQHIDVTPSLHDHVHEKFKRLERHFDRVINAHIVLSVEKQRHHAEASLLVSQNTIFAESTSEDMYAAIDQLIDKLDRQIVKHKEKTKDHHKHEGMHRKLEQP